MAEQQKQVVLEMTIAAPVETVWQALRQPDQMLNWFGWDADTLRDEIQVIFFDHARADEASKVLAFGEYEGIADRIELAAAPGGTALRVMRGGPAVGGDWSALYEDTWEGWITFFEQMRLLIERHPGEKRRTLFLSAQLPEGGTLPIEGLGLAPLKATPAGEAVTANLPVGDRVTGTVWHHSANQVGMTVPAWGDGLLVVTDKRPPNGGPHGGGSVLLTTFGLSDAAFAELEQGWTAWWEARNSKG
ncbi:MAG: hypothetical protein JWQ89_2787 [Devosia sp.]|uniref:SRPBCC family protein n=1 Tax=Devosia sp. TaxID=1871048 RepID=UPI0026093F7A|nr:hypothetical protein [Devosia sp.]MDB5541060.1 hypothetical protein [Devosia sp.]